MSDDFTRQAIAQSLKKMFQGSHFDICTIDHALKALNLHAPPNQYAPLRALHCVHWDTMEADFRDQVFQRVMALFAEASGFNLVDIDRTLGVPITHAIASESEPSAKRKIAGLLPFQRRA